MSRLALRSSWRAAHFIVVDIETSGRDDLISYAAIPIDEGRIVAGRAVTGEGPPAGQAPPPLVSAMRRRILVSHGADETLAFLRAHRAPLERVRPRPALDTALLWRLLSIHRREGDPGSRSLAEVAASLRLPSHRPHEAEGEALTTAQVFLALATHLETHGRATVAALRSVGLRLRAWRLLHERNARL